MRICPTPVVESNLYTMGIASEFDQRQAIPSEPEVPPADVRELRAKLILEEALETIKGLGVEVKLAPNEHVWSVIDDISFLEFTIVDPTQPDRLDADVLEDIVDGCCDVIFVAVGTMLACGVDPDRHLEHVCYCNNAKFPGGVATFNESGKFLKPPGWTPPDHVVRFSEHDDMHAMAEAVIAHRKRFAERDDSSKPFGYVDSEHGPVHPESYACDKPRKTFYDPSYEAVRSRSVEQVIEEDYGGDEAAFNDDMRASYDAENSPAPELDLPTDFEN